LLGCIYSPSNAAAQQQQQHQNLKTMKNAFSVLINKGIDLIYNQGNYTGAIGYFDKILSIDPNNVNATFFKGAALGSLGKPNEAIPLINKAIILSDKLLATDPHNINLLVIKGRAFNRLQNYTEAIKYFDRALAIDPNNTYALANKGLALNKLGNYTEAIKYYDKALAIDPNFVYALSSEGDALSNQGNYTEAIKYYNKALDKSPNYVPVLVNEGNIYVKERNYDQAKKYLDRVLTIDPNNTYALNVLGTILYYQGNQNDAIRYFDKALAIDPNGIDIFRKLNEPQEPFKLTTLNESKNQRITDNNNSSEYTLMVYMVGSDLEAKTNSATQNIQEMEKVGSTSKVNVIVETGGGSDHTKIDGKRFIDFTKVQRHKILHNGIQPLGDLGKQNTGDPNTLSDFIIWGISHFPAKKYAIILWDHGGGINGFGGDQQFNNDKLTIDEIHQAFEDASKYNINKKFELIGFDSCLMASLEVANSVKQFGNYMVASEDIEPQWGWDYSAILRSLVLSPSQNGAQFGKTIANTYFRKSLAISLSQGYSAFKRVTMSVDNLTNVARLVYELDNLASYMHGRLSNFSSVISFAKSAEFAERYGQTSSGNSGLVDAYDLVSNLKQRFPQSAFLGHIVHKSLNDTVIYKINGDANPNANGLSIYMPVKLEEFSDASKYTLPSWQNIVRFQYNLLKSDMWPPVLQSYADGDSIKGHIYGNDVASIKLYLFTSSFQEGNTAIYQDLDPTTFIKSDGSFEYKWNKQILSLCDEHACKPAMMKLEINKDKKFALIPVRLVSHKDKVNEHVSLKYEIDANNKFNFLGAVPEFSEQETTVPREIWPIYPNDNVQPLAYTFDWESIYNLTNVEYGPLQVTQKIEPKFVSYSGTFDILFEVCDYSNHCWTTRTFHFGDSSKTQPSVLDLSGIKLPFCYDNPSLDRSSNFSIYENNLYKFKIAYPSNWQVSEKALPDPEVVEFSGPSNTSEEQIPKFTISSGYWNNSITPQEFLNPISEKSKGSNPFYKLLEANETLLGGYPAYMIRFTQGIGKISQATSISALIGHTMYHVDFTSDLSQYSRYLPEVKKMLESFQICSSRTKSSQGHLETNAKNNSSKLVHPENGSFSIYYNPDSRFKIQYPSNWVIQESENKHQVSFNSPIVSNESYIIGKTSIVSLIVSYSPFVTHEIPVNKFLNEIANTITENKLGTNITESQLTSFKGYPAYRISYSYIDPDQYTTIRSSALVSVIGRNLYSFEFYAESSKYPQYLPKIENMLNSFEISSRLR